MCGDVMCTNIQYLSKEIKDGKLYPEWVFKGSVVPEHKSGRDLTPETLSWMKDQYDKGYVFFTGCGSCLECRVADRRSMASRLHHESRYWKDASFITLTYNNENLPDDGSVYPAHPAEFVLKLRRYLCRRSKCAKGPNKNCRGLCPKIKTFGCMEYGRNPVTGKIFRPHYHLVIFGFQFDDLSNPKECSNPWSKKKWFTYRSQKCADLWKKGFVEIGKLEPAAAEYVCGYTVKKLKGEDKEKFYGNKRPEGVCCRSQGIGKRFVEQYTDFLLRNGMVSFRKSKIPLPRYYKKLLKKLDEKKYLAAVKNWTKEKDLSSIYRAVSPLRAKARGKIKKAQVAQESRSYEYEY